MMVTTAIGASFFVVASGLAGAPWAACSDSVLSEDNQWSTHTKSWKLPDVRREADNLVSPVRGIPDAIFSTIAPSRQARGDRTPLPAPREVRIELAATIQSKQALLAALASAASGEQIVIADDAHIDLTGESHLVIPGGVTLASGGGVGGVGGALLYTTDLDTFPLFESGGAGVRVTGLRIQGPDQAIGSGRYDQPNSRGVQFTHPGGEISHSELWGWSHAAILAYPGADNLHVHHNNIHHNQRTGLGYGVVVSRVHALIERNTFDYCRHCIAATGDAGTSYEAAYNVFGANVTNSTVEIHPGGGNWVKIHHNEFHDPIGSRLVDIKDVTAQESFVYSNKFVRTVHCIRQFRNGVDYTWPAADSFVNITHYDNETGWAP